MGKIISFIVCWLLNTVITLHFVHPVFQQISEKQRSLYEALEKQQHYQSSLQSISSKMEALEAKLSEPLGADKSPDSHIKSHEVSLILI